MDKLLNDLMHATALGAHTVLVGGCRCGADCRPSAGRCIDCIDRELLAAGVDAAVQWPHLFARVNGHITRRKETHNG